MPLTPEQETLRKTYVTTLRKLHIGVTEVFVNVESVIDVLGFYVCETNNLFPYVVRTELEPQVQKNKSDGVLKHMTQSTEMGLAPVDPKLLLRLMEEAGT